MKITDRTFFVNATNFIVFVVFIVITVADRCCRISDRESPMFKLSRSNSRSTEGVVTRRNVASLEKCIEFAVSKKALALNYRETSTDNHRRTDEWTEANCQALECPVIDGTSGLADDARFSHYSVYRSRISSVNVSLMCVPSVGLFYVSYERKNYTNARAACRMLRGSLAHVVSEERTEGLGKLLQNVPTFVGLSNRDQENIWKNEFDEPLTCFDYRAWATNEPAVSRGCVGLVRPRKLRSSSTWIVLPCSRKSPYVCEIHPRSRSNTHRRHGYDIDYYKVDVAVCLFTREEEFKMAGLDEQDFNRSALTVQNNRAWYTGQRAERIPSGLVRVVGNDCVSLDLSYNELTSVSSARDYVHLQELILDNNKLRDLKTMPFMPCLTTLSLNNNKVADIDGALERIKECCPNVVYVSLLGNPGYPDQLTDRTSNDEADYERYRLYALHVLPNSLRFLDSRQVTRQERIDARNRGRLLRTVKIEPRKFTELEQNGFDEIDTILDVNYTPLPQSQRSPNDHKGAYGKCRYRYSGKNSEGNRFISNSDL